MPPSTWPRLPRGSTGGRCAPVALLALLLLAIVGTLGYMAIDDTRFTDALFMTMITLSTVGYEEVQPLSDAGKWYSMALTAVGVGLVFYTVVEAAAFLLEGRLMDLLGRRSTMRAIDAMQGHVLICGFGRLGSAVAEQLASSRTPFVVIEPAPEAAVACEARGWRSLTGSALDDETLAAAGIERARALVAAVGSDADNVFIALSAREHNPKLRIHARAGTAEGVRRLKRAGASRVISPHQLAGSRIANAIVRPGVVGFLQLSDVGAGPEIDLEEVQLGGACGLHLCDLPDHGVNVSVVAMEHGEESLQLHPGPDEELHEGHRVIALGDKENLARLATLARSAQSGAAG